MTSREHAFTDDATGHRWLVRLVLPGERYGRDYDRKYANVGGFGPRGQFVSRYYASTLRERDSAGGLDLCGYEPSWKLSAPALAMALAEIGVIV